MSNASSKIPVSVIVNTKNEERNIAKCLRSLTDFAEVVVIDSYSTDRTKAIAEEMGATVVDFRWNGKYPKKKQWGIENLSLAYDWILHVDADEEVYSALAEEIRSLIASGPRHAGFYVSLDLVFSGRVLRHGLRQHKLVLFKRSACRYLEFADLEATGMGELEGHYQPTINGSVGSLRGRLLHDNHHTLSHYFERHNRYSDWEAVVRLKGIIGNPEESRLLRHRIMKCAFDAIPLKPFVIFGYSYIIQRGFLDGRAGFQYAFAMLFYFWQIGLKMDEIQRQQLSQTTQASGTSPALRPSRDDAR